MTPRDALRLAHPRAVMIQTTSRCNSMCEMCPHPQIRNIMPQGDMNDDAFARLLAEIAAYPPLKRVMLYLMSEPLLDPKIAPRIKAARAALPETELYLVSNGIALTEQLSDELLDAGLTWIGFSLHAARPETYRAITRRRDFAKVREQIARHVRRVLERHGPDAAMINITRVRPYVDEAEWREAIAFWRDQGVRRLDLHEGYISRAGNIAVYGHEPLRHCGVTGCRTVWAYEMAHVLFDGAVIPCCMDYRRRAVWGNVNDSSLLEIWRGEKRRRFLERMDGRELPDDDLCVRCEDALPAEPAAVAADERSAQPEPPDIPDILLVHPPPWLTAGPPLGIAALQAWLAKEGLTAETSDVNIELFHRAPAADRRLWEWEEGQVWERAADVERLFGAALRETAERIAAHPAPVIGFSLTSRKEYAAALLARRVAELAPDKVLLAGGPATADRESRDRLFKLFGGAVKIFVVGEGERVLTAALQRLRAGQSVAGLPGVAFYREGQATFADPPPPVSPRDLPPPDYRGFDLSRYSAPALYVEWSRGCTGDCAFCNIRQYWRHYRAKPAATVLNELAVLRERHGVEWLGLTDPVINGRPQLLEEICDGIAARGWKLRWSGGLSPNQPLTAAQFAKLAAAGCYRLEFGVESGSDRILQAMNKRYTAAAAAHMCRDAHAAGIDVVLYLIVGFPGETAEDFDATLRLAEELAPVVKLVRSVNSLLLIPGADVCERAADYGIAAFDRRQPGWERRWRAGDLTAEVRAARVDRLVARLRALDVPVEFSNRDEVVADRTRHAERLAALQRRAAAYGQRLIDLNLAAERLLAGGPPAAPGDGLLALAICPVWGVDMPPYGLASMAANAARSGFPPAVFDFNVALYRRARPELRRFWEEDSFRHWTDLAEWQKLLPHLDAEIDRVVERLLESGRRIIGFSVYSPNRRFTIEVCRRLKQADPARIIVVGGRGVHTVNERLLFPPASVDAFIIGEGEVALVDWLRAFLADADPWSLPGVDRFIGHHLAGVRSPMLVDAPGDLAPPDYAVFDLPAYRTRDLPLLATRGCTGHCAFCNDHLVMGRYRPRPGRQVAAEMLRCRDELGARSFRFNDQLINGDLAILEDMADALIEADASLEWIALAAPRGDMPDRLLDKLRLAGCKTLNLGLESGSDAVLKKMAKGYRVADIERALAQIRGAGINTMINFIVGFPGETEDDFAQTLALVRRNRAHICGVNSINTCILLLGSPLEIGKDRLGIVTPAGADADTGWVQGANTPPVRQERAQRLLALLAELDIPARVSNLHEKRAALAELTPAVGPAADKPGGQDNRKGVPRYEAVEARDVDVLLIMPPVWGADVPPLGIAYLQRFLDAQGLSSQCLDLNIKLYNRAPDPALWNMEAYKHWTEPELFARTMESLADLVDHYAGQIAAHPARVLGFSLNTGNFAFGRAFARRLKAARPDRPIVFGGPGITNSFDIATLTPAEADYLVLGEGEAAAHLLFRALLAGQKPALDGVLRVGEPVEFDRLKRPICANVEDLAWPRLADFNLAEYATDAVPILGSRGCIRRCAFCNDHHIYQRFRPRRPESIAEEMFWHADQSRTRFTFHDVLINGSIRRLETLCDLLIASGRELRWGGQGVIRKEMTAELFGKMAAAGCQSFVFGVESFSDKVLSLMDKPYTREEAQRVLSACHGAGIETIINLIAGFPGEGEKEFRETYDFLRDHADIIDQVASISPCLINLGSKLFERYPEYGIRFPEKEGSIKWFTEDGNTFEVRRQRVLALTTLLSRRDSAVHTVNLYDEKRGHLPEVELDDRPGAATAPGERPDIVLALPPPWGVEFPPLGLAMLTAALRAQGFRVRPRDLNVEWHEDCSDALRNYWRLEHLKFWSPEGRLSQIVAFFEPRIAGFIEEIRALEPRAVGFSTNESNLPLALELARRIKRELPAMKIIFGGPGVHWAADRERIGPEVDLCVIGEGEQTLPAVLNALREGKAPADEPGVSVRQNALWTGPTRREPIAALDTLPPPDFADLPLHLYRTGQFPLLMGRGCVNRCAFCNDHRMIPGYRAVSPHRLLEQIRQLKKRFGAFTFSFNDLLINADLPRLRRFCELVVEAHERLAWTGQCLVRADMTLEDFKLLKRAGCVSLVFGIESFNDDVLRKMGKRFDAAAATLILQRAKDAGLEVLINLIVGFPGETDESFAETCGYVRAHAGLIDRVSALSTCIVVAQCEMEKNPDAYGIVLPEPEHWRQWHSRDGRNTYEARVKRLRELARCLADAGIAAGMSNLYEEALEEN